MGIGKRLVILGCYTCAASTLVVIAVITPAISSLIITGKPVCVPAVSIRCYETDCGDYFQRCGSPARHEVPSHHVCYRGALFPARRTDLHSCPSIIDMPRNSTAHETPRSCDCDCKCNSEATSQVICKNGKIYPNQDVATCCGQGSCSRVGKQERLVQFLTKQYTELSNAIGRLSLQASAVSFTFQSPLPVSSGIFTLRYDCVNVCG